MEAWECVRLGSYNAVYIANPEVKLQAKALLEKALELDPSYAIAWVMLGWIYQQYADVASIASDSTSPETALALMLECAHKALAADPSCADAYGLLAMYHLEMKEFDQAKEMAEKAISLAPNNAQNLGKVSMVLNKTGNPKRALELKNGRCGPVRCIGPDFFAAWVFRITCWASLIQQLTPSKSLLRGNRSIFLRTRILPPFMASLGSWKRPKNPFAKY